MRTTPANDLRVAKTLETIDTAFRAMMLEGGFSSITVKALCERARINKKTFYRYYECLDDLLAETMATYAAAWHVALAGTSAATLAMYRAWVADGKRIPLDDMCELAVRLLCEGTGGLA